MSEVYVDEKGYAHDDEGNTWKVPGRMVTGVYQARQVPVGSGAGQSSERRRWQGHKSNMRAWGRDRVGRVKDGQEMINAIHYALINRPNKFLSGIIAQIQTGKGPTEKQRKIIREILKKLRMEKEMALFREEKGVNDMRTLIENLENEELTEAIKEEDLLALVAALVSTAMGRASAMKSSAGKALASTLKIADSKVDDMLTQYAVVNSANAADALDKKVFKTIMMLNKIG